MMRVRQLCGGGMYRDQPYRIETIWFGVLIETAAHWLKRCGWGGNRCGCGVAYCDHAPMRLRLKGRCWIEDSDEPAVFCHDTKERPRPDGEPFMGLLPVIQKPLPRVFFKKARRKAS